MLSTCAIKLLWNNKIALLYISAKDVLLVDKIERENRLSLLDDGEIRIRQARGHHLSDFCPGCATQSLLSQFNELRRRESIGLEPPCMTLVDAEFERRY